jgi:hypothetical protein
MVGEQVRAASEDLEEEERVAPLVKSEVEVDTQAVGPVAASEYTLLPS